MTLSRQLQATLDAVLRCSPAQPFFLWRASRRLVVLAYHEVTDADTFASHVDYLCMNTHPVSLTEVIAALEFERPLPRGAVLITFDDGDRSVYEHAMPVLQDRGVPAVAFIVAGLVGTDIPFWWREVEELMRRGASAGGLPREPSACVSALKNVQNEERLQLINSLRRSTDGPPTTMPQLQRSEITALQRAGIAIGNHTFTHPCLDRCSDETLESEIVRAHKTLAEILGRAPNAFAYPNGNADERATHILANLGYRLAFLFDHRIGRFPPSDRYRISRLRIGSMTPPNRFRIVVSGLHSSLHRMVGRV